MLKYQVYIRSCPLPPPPNDEKHVILGTSLAGRVSKKTLIERLFYRLHRVNASVRVQISWRGGYFLGNLRLHQPIDLILS
jgi:hypothetical protein